MGKEGKAYCNLGAVFSSLGQYDKEVEFHTKSLNIFRESGDRAGKERAKANIRNLGLLLVRDVAQRRPRRQHHHAEPVQADTASRWGG